MILYGASGHGKVVADILRLNGVEDIIFFDDNPNAKLSGEKVISSRIFNDTDEVIVTVGLNHIRRKIVVNHDTLKYSSAIHPKGVISNSVEILMGTVVMAGAIINSGSKIGRHVIVNTSAVVDHDCEISDFVHISPNATLCGGVRVGEGTWIGAGAIIKNGITIGSWAVIGAGAVVVSDIPDNQIFVGNPSVYLKENVDFK